MNGQCGRFVWYELLSTDTAGAVTFYRDVFGWSGRDASTAAFAYTILAAGGEPVCGLMELPLEGRRMGARPRWVGYVAVDDAEAAAAHVRNNGGAVYVPPTDSNIGRVSIVADPQTATLAVVEGLKLAEARPRGLDEMGCVGWHELVAGESATALSFYAKVFGWSESRGESGPIESYLLFSAGSQTMGGMFTKLPRVPAPFWLYYFNVSDLDRAIASVNAGRGRVVQGPTELLGGMAMARCVDPQGAMFALRGPRGGGATGDAAAAHFAFSAQWGGFESRGRVIPEPQESTRPSRKPKP
jgi:predicted enzyme related to lactoylglutathione lyase